MKAFLQKYFPAPAAEAGEKFQGPDMRFRFAGFILDKLTPDSDITLLCRDGSPGARIGNPAGQPFTMEIDEPLTLWRIMRAPDPGLGEAYMDGKWSLREGDLGEFLSALAAGRQALFGGRNALLFQAVMNKRPADTPHDIVQSYKQVRGHYDLGNDLYESFLDEGMNYSCAFFDDADTSLREAQLEKIHTTLARLDVRPGMKVLEIGSGWGEMCRLLAERTGAAQINGITLAKNQHKTAKEKARDMSAAPLNYYIEDYREHAAGHARYYDRILSVGMFEHVGEENRGRFFGALRHQLAPEGRALIHSIVRSGALATAELSSPWLERYIFPGGAIPELDDMIEAAEKQGLELTHEPYIHESFHYAETLRRWRANFNANRGRLDPEKYDERFVRMWNFYFAMCEAMFDGCGYRVAQLVLKRS